MQSKDVTTICFLSKYSSIRGSVADLLPRTITRRRVPRFLINLYSNCFKKRVEIITMTNAISVTL